MEFQSLYPIHAAAMNKVSDAKLAIAVHKSGCIPSMSIFNYIRDSKVNYDLLQKDLHTFITKANTKQLVLSISSSHLSSSLLFNIIKQTGITHLEIIIENLSMYGTEFDYDNHTLLSNVTSALQKYKDLGLGIVLKSLTKFIVKETEMYYHGTFDYYMLKGADAAGTIIERQNGNLLDEVKELKEFYPDIKLIIAGGIGNGTDAKKYLNAGADIVALGTLFAMCKESCVDQSTKEKIISSKKISQFEGLKQNAFMLEEYDDEDDINHSRSLASGIKGNTKGHVFVGKGLKDISSVVTVNNMVQNFIRSM